MRSDSIDRPPSGDELVVGAARGLAGRMGARRPISSSVARFAFAEHGTLLIEDAATDPRVNRGWQNVIGDTSHICVPLFQGEVPVAVLQVISASETERLKEEDRRTLELLAVGLSAAVSRAAEFRAKREQVDALARFEAVFASALTGMMVLSLDGHVLGVNPALQELLGFAAHEIVGHAPTSSCTPRTSSSRSTAPSA
jgi:GAF domain-containing protein